MNLGDYAADTANLDFKFPTRNLSATPTSLLGTPVVGVYKGNSLVQSVAGVVLTVDFDGVTGSNHVSIDLSADAFYEISNDYQVVLSAGTVDGIAVSNEVLATFSIQHRFDSQTGDNFPETSVYIPAAIAAIGTGSTGARNFAVTGDNVSSALKGVTFVGVATGGTYLDVDSEDSVYDNTTHVGNAIDKVYEITVPAAYEATEISFIGYLISGNDEISVQVYDDIAVGWDQRKVVSGQNAPGNVPVSIKLLAQHTGSGADLGKVYVRFVCSAQSSPDLFVDELLASAVNTSQTVGYADGALWLNGNKSNTNVVPFTDGTADNPVSTWAAILSLSASVGLDRVRVAGGTDIILTSDSSNMEIIGQGYTVDLGGQNIDALHVVGGTLSGIGSNTGSHPVFEQCPIAVVTLHPCIMRSCWLQGSLTVGAVGNFYINDCRTRIPGGGQFPIDLGAVIGGTGMSIKNASGGFSITNSAAGDIMSIGGPDMGTLTINGTGGSVDMRGIGKPYVDASGGAVTIVGTGYPVTSIGVIESDTAAIINDLSNATDGLGALKILIDAVNTDLSNGTDGLGALKALIDLAQLDLDKITGADGVTLATLQALYAPAKAGDSMAVVDKTGFALTALDKAAIVTLVLSDTLGGYSGSELGHLLKKLGDLVPTDGSIDDVAPTTTQFKTNLPNGIDYHGITIVFDSNATNNWLGRVVQSSSWDGVNTTLVFDEVYPNVPANGDNFIVVAGHEHTVTEMQAGLATEAKQDAVDIVVAETKVVVDDLAVQIGVAGNGLTDMPAGTLTTGERTSIATALLAHNMGAGRTVEQVFAAVRNRVDSADLGGGLGTITVYDTDNITVLYIADTGLDPSGLITSVVPRT